MSRAVTRSRLAVRRTLPLNHGVNLELPANRPNVLRSPLEIECRSSGDDPDAFQLGKGIDDLLGQPIAEDFTLRTTAHVRERKYGYRGLWRGFSCLRFTGDWSDEPITALWEGLDESRTLRGITQRLAQPRNGSVQVGVEINEYVCRPEAMVEFFPGDDFTGVLEE